DFLAGVAFGFRYNLNHLSLNLTASKALHKSSNMPSETIPIYLWWYPSSYTLNVALLGLFFIYTLVFHIKEKTLYMAIILAS
ncbi:hypothetical protein VWN94_10930, partial [Campylobacter coli]|uniref:hypothetical protein n=1 Tax=Campylobacter coli TaxID=195 RepID=UPI002E31B2F6